MIPTVKLRQQDAEAIQKELEEFFKQLIYYPLVEVINKELPKPVQLNASATDEYYLMLKIQHGDILYDGAYFTGKFNAQTSRTIRDLGGKWDAKVKGFKLTPGKLTPDLKVAISASKERLERMNKGMKNVLSSIEPTVEKSVDDLDLSKGIEKVIAGLQAQTIKAMDAIGVKYTLTASQKEAIKKDYNDNIKIYIKSWSQEKIKDLRAKVTENAETGYRASELVKMIQHDYGTSKNKAKFLARQETSLFMSKFRRERFLQAGVQFYEWRTSNDGKVRHNPNGPDHRALNHRIFQYGDPPIVDHATGARKEPGEDFNCRCVAIPVQGKVEKRGTEWRKVL